MSLVFLQLSDTDRASLAKLRSVMGVSQFEGERAIEAVTAPLYRETLAQAFAEAATLKWGDPAVDALREKIKVLCIEHFDCCRWNDCKGWCMDDWLARTAVWMSSWHETVCFMQSEQ